MKFVGDVEEHRSRARELAQDHETNVARQVDRLFGVLLIVELLVRTAT